MQTQGSRLQTRSRRRRPQTPLCPSETLTSQTEVASPRSGPTSQAGRVFPAAVAHLSWSGRRQICLALPAYWACAPLRSLLGNVVLPANLAARGRQVSELQVRIPSLHLRTVGVGAGLWACFLNCKMGLIIATGFLRLWSLFQGMAFGKI